MNKDFKNLLPLIIFVVLFFLLTIGLTKYFGLKFDDKKEKQLSKIITVEAYENKKQKLTNCIG